MKRDYVRIRVEMENNAETWWDALRAKYPCLCTSLARHDIAIIRREFLPALKELPGFANGPAHAREALIVDNDVDGNPRNFFDSLC